MFLRHLSPMIASHNLEETISFYTSVLGFKLHEKVEQGARITWCSLYRDNVWIMFVLSEPGGPAAINGSLYFYPSDVEEWWQQLQGRPEVLDPVCDTEYGMREFSIRDNNGNVLRFGKQLQPINAFDKHFPPSLVLETSLVRLQVLKEDDVEVLQPLTSSPTTWKYFTKDLTTPAAAREWILEAVSEFGNCKRVPFLIIDRKNDRPAGTTSYGNISFFDKRIEIGWSWLGDAFKGTGINTHAKFLLLQHAFDILGMERVEIKTDQLNERARTALVKIGATAEAVLRSHMQMHSDRRRDSIYYSILKNEWPKIREEIFSSVR